MAELKKLPYFYQKFTIKSGKSAKFVIDIFLMYENEGKKTLILSLNKYETPSLGDKMPLNLYEPDWSALPSEINRSFKW